MLVYRGMDIGTAKPGPDELARVPHHLVDVLDITTTSSVALVQTMARHAIEDCRERDVLPLVVGGSALYSRAVLDELDIPPTDPAVRARLEADLEELGSRALHDRLAERDPRAAASILPGNGRRIVRALEVVELTGSFSATMPQGRFHIPGTVEIGLNLSRDDLDRRIAERVDRMWRDGLVDEVRRLAGRGLRQGRTASRALGYRQVLQYLDGMIDEDRARLDTVVRTRRFARKQLMWYRRDPRIRWFDALSPRLVEQVAEGMRLT
ncbi:tRNA dimethylallyltransferase [Acidipropionibacterium acidipropionici]|nr:tRNA dimethylallyltransferase [Acidipropionibacterium acidipropionici]AMS06967.1 tRNA dimethylallyltransferase [Acidipropionibacterium acidipropionici]AOZ48148.1 tRNA (adenosine(37)-N6)-dimethylallyltransferase MiaA [Acidipropionibacterium acidipropionici]